MSNDENPPGPDRTIIRPSRRAAPPAPAAPLPPASPYPAEPQQQQQQGGGWEQPGGANPPAWSQAPAQPYPAPPPPEPVAAPAYPPAPPHAAIAGAELSFSEGEPELHGPEPLVAAASRLIRLGGELRTMPVAPDLVRLRALVVRERAAFAARAQRLGVEAATVRLADYTLCAFIDDAVMTTPWGNGSAWTKPTLLAEFHNDTRGGEAVFNIASHMEQDPRREPRLLELVYLCLSLGFEGRMAMVPQGEARLSNHRDGLHNVIRRMREAPVGDLSPQWRGKATPATIRAPLVPLWAALAGIAAVALLVFSVLYFRLSAQSDAAIASLSETVGTAPLTAPPAPAAPLPGFAQMGSILQPDIDAGRVKLLREGGDVVIRLVNQGVFESGTAELARDLSDTFGRIAQAAKIAGGPLKISGHTDNQPVKATLSYPSNQALSEARANAVRDGLAKAGIADSQLSATGYADSQPIADNATPAGRQENRRVEIRVASNAAWE